MITAINDSVSCAILADRHSVISDRIRDLLRASFGTIFTVADPASLLQGALHLAPALIAVDLSFDEQGAAHLIRRIRTVLPDARIIALSLYDNPAVAQAVIAAGAAGVVLKRSIGDDLLPAVDTVLAGGTYVSPGFEPDDRDSPAGH